MRPLRGRRERTPQSITWPTAAPPTDHPAEPRGWAGSPRLPPATMQRPLGESQGAGAGGRRLCAPGAGWPGGCRCREQEGHRRPERRSDLGDREWGPRGQAGECQQWNSPLLLAYWVSTGAAWDPQDGPTGTGGHPLGTCWFFSRSCMWWRCIPVAWLCSREPECLDGADEQCGKWSHSCAVLCIMHSPTPGPYCYMPR